MEKGKVYYFIMSVAHDRRNAACIGQLSVYLFEKKREEKDDKQATVSSEMKENSCSADRQKKSMGFMNQESKLSDLSTLTGFFYQKEGL